MSKPKQ